MMNENQILLKGLGDHGRVWGSFEDYYIFHSGATIESLSLKKEKLHHKGSDGKREEDGEAGSGDSPGTVGALFNALVAGVAFIRGAHLFNFLFRLGILIMT